jgi:N-acetylmuramoyl-L-alanine amidase
MRSLSDITKIIIHCSDSEFGDVHLIDQWHKERGFRSCGYHYVITNGVITHGKSYNPDLDGIVQPGRQLREIGAHCKGHNTESIGICLIGRHAFTAKQLYQALPNLILTLGNIGLTADDVYGHRDFSSKPCPNIDTALLRLTLRSLP